MDSVASRLSVLVLLVVARPRYVLAEDPSLTESRLRTVRTICAEVLAQHAEGDSLRKRLVKALDAAGDNGLIRCEVLGLCVFELSRTRDDRARRQLLDVLSSGDPTWRAFNRTMEGRLRRAASVQAGKVLAGVSVGEENEKEVDVGQGEISVILRSPMNLAFEALLVLDEVGIVRILVSREEDLRQSRKNVIGCFIRIYVQHVEEIADNRFVPLPRKLYSDVFAAVVATRDELALAGWLEALVDCFDINKPGTKLWPPRYRVEMVPEIRGALSVIERNAGHGEDVRRLCRRVLSNLEDGIKKYDTVDRRDRMAGLLRKRRDGWKGTDVEGLTKISPSPAHKVLIDLTIGELKGNEEDYVWDIWCDYVRMKRIVDPIWSSD